MEELQAFVIEHGRELLTTAVLTLVILAIRWMLMSRFLRQEDLDNEVRRRLIVNARNLTLVALVIGIALIWGPELEAIAFSMFAVAAAIVIATKELILCLSGTFVRSQMFAVGDRIEIGNVRGDVIDKTTLVTRLLEIGPGHEGHQYTGRTVVIPNSRLLTDPVINESSLGEYLLHVVPIPLKQEQDWRRAREILLRAARRISDPYVKQAAASFGSKEKDAGHYMPSAEPRVSVALIDSEKLTLHLRLPIPKGRKHRIEQQILNEFLAEFPHGSTTPAPRPSPDGSAPTDAAPTSMAGPGSVASADPPPAN